jgi:hypothetical protein
MAFSDYFIGVAQSKYAAVAMFAAIVVLCISILLTNTEISLGNRILVVVVVLLMSILPVGLSLFELTCMVTGGKSGGKYNACHLYAWFVAILVVIYCFILIILTLMSMFTYKKAMDKVDYAESYNNISREDANIIARNMMQQDANDQDNDKDVSYESMPQKPPPDMPKQTTELVAPRYSNKASLDEPLTAEIPGDDESYEFYDPGADYMDFNANADFSQFSKLDNVLPKKPDDALKPKLVGSKDTPEAFTVDSKYASI